MEASKTFSAAIVEYESSARTALQPLLTDIGFSHLIITHDLDHPSLNDPLLHYPLIFVGWKIWDHRKSSILHILRKDFTHHAQKILLFVTQEDPVNLLEAVRLGIDGYITYPFSLRSISQKVHMLLPQMHVERHEAHTQRYSRT